MQNENTATMLDILYRNFEIRVFHASKQILRSKVSSKDFTTEQFIFPSRAPRRGTRTEPNFKFQMRGQVFVSGLTSYKDVLPCEPYDPFLDQTALMTLYASPPETKGNCRVAQCLYGTLVALAA